MSTRTPERPAPRPVLRRRRRGAAAAVVAGAVALVAGAVTLLHHSAAPPAPTCRFASASGTWSLSPAQAQDAAIIAAVGHRLGLPDHAVTVALAAALQESQLVDLPSGDRDSVGLFQQRPSQGWGTPAQLLDPAYAAAAFYGGLQQVAGWEAMAVTDAAQAVQRSAAPTAYATWEAEARAAASALTGEVVAGLTCRMATYGGAAPARGALAGALAAQYGPSGAGGATGAPAAAGASALASGLDAKSGWQVAAWAVAHAYAYHLAWVATAGRTWTAASGRWVAGGPGAAVAAGAVVAASA